MSTPRVDATAGGDTILVRSGEPEPVSFFTRARWSHLLSSVGQESTTAVLSPFFAGTLGAAPVVIAGVEAAGRAGGTVARFGGSGLARRRPGARGLLDVAGYGGAALAAVFLAGSSAVWQAGACRSGSWVASGLGTPTTLRPVSEQALVRRSGRQLGQERAYDALAAAVGPLIAVGLLAFASVRTVLLLAIVPAVVAGVASAIGARATRRAAAAAGGAGAGEAGVNAPGSPPAPGGRTMLAQLRGSGPLGRLLVGVTLYEASNIAAALLLLRAAKILPEGAGAFSRLQAVAMLYVVYQLSSAACAAWAGRVVDRLGAGVVVAIGAVALLIAYAGFAFANPGELAVMIGCFVLAGAAAGAVDAAEYAGVARLTTPDSRAPALSALIGLQNAGRVFATITAGGLWTLVGPSAGLLICGPLLIVAVLLLSVRPVHAADDLT
ncbi:MFS transporter [Frankia sp. Ag45/Mut15]|uniref:MFS transporter n=1 Tax=Frankia umida TaxID=573489 RepID=A0ABT0K552_9ACTN|nr:MFS transporter [Frankia umida]MCK9878927.1 MFS transporter [Frankia umida]